MSKNRKYDFQTLSNKNLKDFYKNPKDSDVSNGNINDPGDFPYTRGIHANMYI